MATKVGNAQKKNNFPIIHWEDGEISTVDETAPEAIEKVMLQTVIKVASDIENMSFNTANVILERP